MTEKSKKERRTRSEMITTDLQKVQRNLKKVWLDVSSNDQNSVMQLLKAAETLENAVNQFFNPVAE